MCSTPVLSLISYSIFSAMKVSHYKYFDHYFVANRFIKDS